MSLGTLVFLIIALINTLQIIDRSQNADDHQEQVPNTLVRSGPNSLTHPVLFELTCRILVLNFLADCVQVPDFIFKNLLTVLLAVAK